MRGQQQSNFHSVATPSRSTNTPGNGAAASLTSSPRPNSLSVERTPEAPPAPWSSRYSGEGLAMLRTGDHRGPEYSRAHALNPHSSLLRRRSVSCVTLDQPGHESGWGVRNGCSNKAEDDGIRTRFEFRTPHNRRRGGATIIRHRGGFIGRPVGAGDQENQRHRKIMEGQAALSASGERTQSWSAVPGSQSVDHRGNGRARSGFLRAGSVGNYRHDRGGSRQAIRTMIEGWGGL